MEQSQDYYAVIITRLILACILSLAPFNIYAQKLDKRSVDFGWVLGDGSIFMEYASVYDDDRFLERFSDGIEPIPLSDGGTLMCEYRTIASLDEFQIPSRTGEATLVLVNGDIYPGKFAGYVYVRDQVTGYHLPGEHIILDNQPDLPSCDQEDCEFYCLPALILRSDFQGKIDSINAIADVRASDVEPAVREFGGKLMSGRPEEDECWISYFGDNAGRYFISSTCLFTNGEIAVQSRYFEAICGVQNKYIFNELAIDSSQGTPGIRFLSEFRIGDEEYLFAKSIGYESLTMSVYLLKGEILKLVADSYRFGV